MCIVCSLRCDLLLTLLSATLRVLVVCSPTLHWYTVCEYCVHFQIMSNERTAAEWLDSFDWDEYEDAGGGPGCLFDDAEKKLNVKSRSELTLSKFFWILGLRK